MSRPDRPYQALARIVRQARLAKGLSQRQLSRALGMSQGYAGHLEGGRFSPTVQTLKALASVLVVSYGQLAVEAGYIDQQEFDNPIDERELARLHEVRDLTEAEWESVQDYARYVKSRRPRAT